MPPPAERILTNAPTALACALRIECADDAAGFGSSRFEEIESVLHAVLDACSSLEAVSSDAVVAAADSFLLPALTEMLSSRMWWDQSGAAAYSSENTAQLLAAVASACERANGRSTIASTFSASHTVVQQREQFSSAADPTTRELIDSLLAAQADMAARLRVMEDGMARIS